jgi:PadR family transcriptional regulator PadR
MSRSAAPSPASKAARKNNAAADVLLEWKRGMLSFWVLGLLLTRPRYGLEIRREIEEGTQGRISLGVSTLYQLLRRLERRGLMRSRWKKSTQGPPRAYYRLTPAGRDVVRRFSAEILSPQSPINAGLGRLTAALFEAFGSSSSPKDPYGRP